MDTSMSWTDNWYRDPYLTYDSDKGYNVYEMEGSGYDIGTWTTFDGYADWSMPSLSYESCYDGNHCDAQYLSLIHI